MIVIPAIDLKNGLCVRLLQGRKSEMTVYNEDPVAVARAFAAAGAEMIHVVDLDGAFNEDESPNRAVVRQIIKAVDVPIEFGGGIRTIEDVRQLCDAGVTRVVVGTMAAEQPDMLVKFVDEFPEKICVGIDARSSQTQHGLGKIRNWRIPALVGHQHGVSRRIHRDCRRQRRIQNVKYRLERFLIGFLRETGNTDNEQCDQTDDRSFEHDALLVGGSDS